MEVLTPTGRPRYIPSQQQRFFSTASTTGREGGGGTMTRSSGLLSHHSPHHNGQSSPPSSTTDTSIRDKTKLLQLAEKVHTKKGGASSGSSTPNYTKSFRLSSITSAVGRNNNNKNDNGSSTPSVRRTNSTMLSSSSSSSNSGPPPVTLTRSKGMENYKNPKLYASFSSKSSSKLTKALIRSDPAKTNIEHLVNHNKTTPSPPSRGGGGSEVNSVSHHNSVNTLGGRNKSSTKPSSDHNADHHHYSNGGGGGGGLSSFITPLKALHASFHERSSKLGQTRAKLFSHHHNQQQQQHNRDSSASISGSNAKLLFGTQENLHSSSIGGSASSSSSVEDILAQEQVKPHSRANYNNRRANAPTIITSNNNSKNVASSSTTTPTSHNTPDFLSSSSSAAAVASSTTNGHHINNDNHLETNGFDDKPRNTNGFVSSNTPDILGGCLDVPSHHHHNNDGNQVRARPSYNNPTTSPSHDRMMSPSNGCGRKSQLQPVTNNYSDHSHDALLSKRKNIVVRMSYAEEEDEEGDVFDSDGHHLHHSLVINGGGVEGMWSTSPIMVSTVTPKLTRHQSGSGASGLLTVSNYCGEDEDGDGTEVVDVPVPIPPPTFSSFLASGGGGAGRNVRTSRGGVLIQPPPRTSSILSSSASLLKKSPATVSSEGSQNGLLRISENLGGDGDADDKAADSSSLEGAGRSSSWLHLKKDSATLKGGINYENDISNRLFDKLSMERAEASPTTDDNAPSSEVMPLPKETAHVNGGRSRRGLCMDEASLGSGGFLLSESRPQTALLSDEYAQYLGYGGERESAKEHQAQARLNKVLHQPPLPIPENDEGDDEKLDVFGDGSEKNTTMLAITTTTSPSRKIRRNLTSIMKPQSGGGGNKRHDQNGKRLIQHSVSFRGGSSQLQQEIMGEGESEKRVGVMLVKVPVPNTTVVDVGDDGRSCARLAKLGLSESFSKFDRKRSRSLPKSFMSVRNGLRSVLPSQWVRGDGHFERLTDQEPNNHSHSHNHNQQADHPERKSSCLEEENRLSSSSSSSSVASIPPTAAAINNLEEGNKEQLRDRLEAAESASRPSPAEEAFKMRWHKLGSSSASFSDRRPKSFDYAQRKAWMKLYRDMEVSQASSTNPSSGTRLSRPLTKGSITHLHLEPSSSSQDVSSGNLQLEGNGGGGCASADYVDGEQGSPPSSSSATMMRSSADISSTSPSLFKRFSKTFSLRFGSGSNVSKQQNNSQHGSVGGGGDQMGRSKGKSSKGAIGSSPDLFNSRLEVDVSRDKVNGKMRKTNVKSVRGDKCQSGDSGIGMEETEPHHHRQISNLRRIRSDYISPSSSTASSAISSYTSRAHQTNGSALAKLSLVEIPDHSWDENTSSSSPNGGSGSATSSEDTASYEEYVDAKLDQDDDGFSSSDEGHHHHQQDPSQSYYHSLPHRKRNKRRLKEQGSINSCGAGDTPQEDNSIRGKVVREIIHTEQNYVKTLNDIVQGFLNPCRARNDLFSSRTVQNIFSNIEEILRLHVKFLEALKSKVDPTFVSKSSVGSVFTLWADRFSLYSEYCCNNPISVATVRSLVQFPQYAEFFEACRRLQMMDKLPLHGFLLRPIQRICQYHLQLNELLKHTEESHTDHQAVVEALETMKAVANRINDTQRQFESLQEIIRFQNSIDGWEGHNLVDRNAVILRKGELVKVTHGRKQKEVYVAILNKDLIYCKKDFMKKSGYVYDGRIDLNLRMWINIDSNEEDEFFGMVHNSWRIYSPERRAWILFTAPSPTEKRKWISALEKTKEDLPLDPKLREMAVVTTALADSEIMSNGNAHGHHSNTLPKSSKKSKGKHHLTVTKVDSDAMLIEVGKLKRSTVYTTTSNSTSQPSSREGTSKFYV